MKCFNHYGGYLCLPRSAYVVTAPEPSSQSEPSVPVRTSEAFNPCPVGYRAQGDTCAGESFRGRCGKSYSYGLILNMCISVVYWSSSSFRGLRVCVCIGQTLMSVNWTCMTVSPASSASTPWVPTPVSALTATARLV